MLPNWANPALYITSTRRTADFLVVHGGATRVVPVSGGRTSNGTLPRTHSEICGGVRFAVVIVVERRDDRRWPRDSGDDVEMK